MAGVCTGDGPCDTHIIGTGKNWVTDVDGLPLYIRAIARALLRAGHSESGAISTAVAAVKRWAAGEGDVTPATKARAAAAVAEWERKRAQAHELAGGRVNAIDLAATPLAERLFPDKASLGKAKARLAKMPDALKPHFKSMVMARAKALGASVDLAVPTDLRAAARKKDAEMGEAMSDGSYPTSTRALFDKAVRAVGRGGASHDKIRRYLIGRAKAEGWPIPENWNADGSLKTADMAVSASELLRRGRVLTLANGERKLVIDLGMVAIKRPDPGANSSGIGVGGKTASTPPGMALPGSMVHGSGYTRNTPQDGPDGDMQMYAPTGAELQDVSSRLRAIDALKSRGHGTQAKNVEDSLVREKSSRARKMANGAFRSHTEDEVRKGLAEIRKANATR